jgi:ABC-type siderophore export system fused ATPase/permease subunit
VLVVTHDPRALPFADRIIHMEDGHILREECDIAVNGRTAKSARVSTLTPARPGWPPRQAASV